MSTYQTTKEIRPQKGPQTKFLASPADIVIYGGAAGGGKTWALLLEPLRHVQNEKFGAVIFRRTYPQVTNEGGLWDKAGELYPLLGARPRMGDMQWVFPAGPKIKFAHLQHETNIYDWQGSEVPLFEFDELTHFTETQFFYMLSRNRSMSGIRPYIRAATNPDADSWVAKLIAWWIGEDGFPLYERSGVVRWFIRVDEVIQWANSPSELIAEYGPSALPKSLTFIPARITDNQALLRANPEYLANLQALSMVDRARLLDGNWKVRPEAGKVFNRAWFDIVDTVPQDGIDCRFWDFAASEKELKGDDPDYTAGVKIRKQGNTYYILDCINVRKAPAEIDSLVKRVAANDLAQTRGKPIRYKVRWEIEPGSAGIRENWRLVTMLDGYDCGGDRPEGDKLTRAKPLASQAEVKNVKLLRGAWNEEFLTHMHHQPDWPHDDIMDATAGSFNVIADVVDPELLNKIANLN